MERYEAYKDSGVEWIGEIPVGWKVCRLRSAAAFTRGSGIKRDDVIEIGMPCVRYGELYTTYAGFINNAASHVADDLWRSSTKANHGELVMALTGETKRDIGPAAVNLTGVPVAIGGDTVAIRPLKQDGRFLSYALNSSYMATQKFLDATGEIIVHLGVEKLRDEAVVLPLLAEQRAIADFLDAKTAEIDGLVADCEREVELLQEYRKAVISEAVTKGLDPNAPMKDSGVEWIGEIPEGWSAVRVDKVALRKSGHTPDKTNPDYWNGDIVWVSLADSPKLRNGRYISNSSSMTTSAGIAGSSAELLPKGAVLLSRDASVGLTAIAGVDLAVSQHFMAYICGVKLNNEFLRFAFLAMHQELEKLSMGSTIPTIGLPLIRKLSIPLPPREAQGQIVSYLDAKTAEIDSLIDSKRQMIEKLREYRKSLISEAVTGKFKVPGV